MANAARPKRWTLVCGLDLLAGYCAIVIASRLVFDGDERGDFGLGVAPLIGLIACAAFLFVAAVLAISGARRSRWLLLSAAVLFFGALAWQQLVLLPEFGAETRSWLLAAAAESALALAFNAWALLSRKTASYLGAAR